VPAAAAAIRVFSSNGVRAVLEHLQPDLERRLGRPLTIEFSTASSLKRRIDAGEIVDVAILTSGLIDDLARGGRVVADSRRDLARVGVGVGMAAAARPLDVGTPEALREVLIGARSVAFTAEGQSRAAIDHAFDRLGIADAIRGKVVLKGPGEAPAAVAAGEAEVVLTLISEIVATPGLRLLGPFPADLQASIVFTAARGSHAQDVAAAEALLRDLSGPQFAAALPSHGFESVSR